MHSGLGRLPVGVSVEEFGRRSLESGQNLVRVNNGVMEIASPIAVGGQPLGGVWISLGSEALQAQIRAIIIEHSLQGLALMVAGAAVSYFIARQLTRPVKMLVDATNEIASGQLEARVQGVRGGELVELAGSFNRMAEQLQARVQDLQESRARIVTVQEGVRRDMAAHLHGRVQGRLLVLRANLEQVAAQDLPEVARCSLREVLEQMDQVIHDELSGVSRRLYPSILRRGLGPALGSLCDQFESSFSLELEVDQGLVKLERSDRNFVPEPVRLAAYRISEESLTNIVKHAGATRVEVRVSLRAGDTLCLTIEDNGRGFDVDAAASGLGMAAIMDYAGAVGGECIVRSAPGAGTAVTATFLVAGLVTGLAATPGAEPQEKVSPWE